MSNIRLKHEVQFWMNFLILWIVNHVSLMFEVMNLIIYSTITKELSKNYRTHAETCLKNNALKVTIHRTLSMRYASLKWWLRSCCWDKTKERRLTREVRLMNSSVCAGTLSAFSTRGSLGVLSWCAEASGDINTLLLALKPLLWVRVTRWNKLFPFDYWYCYMAISKRETNQIQSFCCCWHRYDVRSFFYVVFYNLCNKSRWHWLINDVI